MNPTEELAAGMGSMDWPAITALLDAGADIDVQEEHGWTLLVRGMLARSLDECTKLLRLGASIHVRDHEGWTVWDCLHPYYGGALYNDNTPFYSLLLQYGADVNQYSQRGWTALHWACLSNYYPIIHLLLTEGADPRLPVLDGNDKGKTAYDLGDGSFWETPDGIRARFRWDTISIQEVFIFASERGLVPIPSYLW